MTPEEYIAHLHRLFQRGKNREALDFAARVQPTLEPPLNADQLDRVGGGLEGAAMAVAMLDAEATPDRATA